MFADKGKPHWLETVDERAKRECQEVANSFLIKPIDRLAEIEKIILDKLIEKGYIVGSGDWGFKIEINSIFKSKSLNVLLQDKDGIRPVFSITKEKLEEVYDEAGLFFVTKF